MREAHTAKINTPQPNGALMTLNKIQFLHRCKGNHPHQNCVWAHSHPAEPISPPLPSNILPDFPSKLSINLQNRPKCRLTPRGGAGLANTAAGQYPECSLLGTDLSHAVEIREHSVLAGEQRGRLLESWVMHKEIIGGNGS